MRVAALASATVLFASTAHADIVWDQGVDTATSGGGTLNGCWLSQSDGQNFTDMTLLAQDTPIVGLTFDSCEAGLLGRSFQVRVESDLNGDGIPDTSERIFNSNAIGEEYLGEFNGNDVYRYRFEFDAYEQLAGRLRYWGVSGNGFDASQVSHVNSGLPYANNKMYLYNGNYYAFETGAGDQAFQLLTVPAPGALPLLLLGYRARRHR